MIDWMRERWHGYTRADEILRRAAAEVWHGADESGDRQGTEPGIAGCFRTAVRGNRIVEGAHRGIRSAHRATRQGSVSRSCSAQTGEGSRNTDRFDLRSDPGRSASLSPKSRCRMFSRVAAWAPKLWYE